MGCGSSKPEDAEAKDRSKQIDKQLKDDAKRQESVIKLLLLGAGESGKSTIFKQMQIIHRNGYGKSECAQYRDVCLANCIQSMKALIAASSKLRIPLDSEDDRVRAERIMAVPDQLIVANPSKIMTPALGDDITILWNDKGIQTAYARRNEFQINDSAEYFITNVDRMVQPGYLPSQEDVLRSRVKTVGIHEEDFLIDGYKFKFVDVGGQRNERRKWIHCFDDVTAIIFVTSLSEYDQKLAEDESSNRMRDSLALFQTICNTKVFESTPIIIFFNKKDLFEDKIKRVDLNVCFPEYDEGLDYNKAAAYVEDRFLELNKNKSRQIYVHQTCATDTTQIRVTLKATQDILLKKTLSAAGLL